MGCGSSNQVPTSNSRSPSKSEYSPKLLLVPSAEKPDQGIQQIRYYSLANCQLEGTLDLPSEGKLFQSGFTIAPHPRLPVLYLTGCYREGEKCEHAVWRINIKSGLSHLLTSLPADVTPELSVVNSTGEDKDFLYIFGDKGQCQRLDVATNNIQEIVNPMPFETTLNSVLCIQELLYLIVGEKLIKLDPNANEKGTWTTVLKSGVPKGHYTVLGDKIVVIDIQNKAVSQCTPKTGSLENVDDVDCNIVKKSISVIGIGKGYLYFTEPLGSEERVSVMEYNLSKNRAAAAGFIEDCPVKHKLVICWA